jgi:transposase
LKGVPNEEVYRLKKQVLGGLETLSENGLIDLYYGDESGVNLEPNVPYGWQFADEEVSMPSAKGKGVNCFGLFTRTGKAVVATSENSIEAEFVIEQLERLSFSIGKITVVVLDNARIHTGKQMIERIGYWQSRGLFIFYLPTYSPHLNIAETVWRKLKYEWLAPNDYQDGQRLRYSVKQILNEFGKSLRINFSDFNHSLN